MKLSRSAVTFLTALLSVCAVAAVDLEKDVWFLADFDTPTRVNGEAHLQKQEESGFVDGKFGKAYYFFRAKDKKSPSGTLVLVSNREQLSTFPYRAGTSACWVKNAPGVSEKDPVYLWGFNIPGASPWGLSAGSFAAGAGGTRLPIKRVPRRNEWTHVACSWREGRIAYFIDGQLASEVKSESVKTAPQNDPRATFRIGNYSNGWGPCNAILDEFVIFNRALGDDEIAALAKATKSLTDGSQDVLSENILFRTFFRDQDDAKMRVRVVSPEAGKYTLKMKVGDVEKYATKVSVKEGVSSIDLPIRPALYTPGTYEFKWALFSDKGECVLKHKGDLTIKGRLGKDPFILNSWGGWRPVHYPLCKTIGINSQNVYWHEKDKIRSLLNEGIYANIRYENGNEWLKQDFDWEGIRAKAVADLSYLATLPTWCMTLLNSEIYGANVAQKAKDNPKYLKMVQKEIGVKPDFNYDVAPAAVNYKRAGIKPLRGEIDHKVCPMMETLCYVVDDGLPSILSNYETAKAIKSVKDVLVWSEPMWGGLVKSVDMGASWEYEYSIHTTLWQLLSHSAGCRAHGKPYMPTLASGYWPEQYGFHPTRLDKKGKPERIKMTQGSDEVVIKTWLALGAIPTHNLSWFALDYWEYGISNAVRYATSPTNAMPYIAEVDCAERYGKRWREELAPAADLLRDLPNVRAKVGLLSLPEIAYAGGFWWGHHHYRVALSLALSKGCANYDFVGRNELMAGQLADYEYIIYPMSRVVYREHAEALRALAKRGVKIVLDSYASVRYPNDVHLDKLSYKVNKYAEMQADLGAWYNTVVADVATRQGASSVKTDGKTSFTFEKEYKGVRYVTVINDLRDPKPSFLNTFKTNDWYRVVGAPQRIETEIRNVAKGGRIYLFNGRGRKRDASRNGSTITIGGMYGPAEGAVYCVYPKALAAPSLSLEGTARPGTTAQLVVCINDVDGKPAPGRQVVELTFVDGKGIPRDESGRYVVENGVVKIPLRIAKSEKTTGLLSKWTAKVVDLTTGKSEELKIAIK